MTLDFDAAFATLCEATDAINDASVESWDEFDEDSEEYLEPRRRFEQVDYCCSRLMVADLGGLLAVHYYGSEYSGWSDAMDAIGAAGVAEHIGVLHISGPDSGANGLTTWDFAGLINAAPNFTRLTDLIIPQSDTGDHNQKCVEEGHLPGLIARMPALVNLTLPHAPEREFFDIDLPKLATIKTGRDFRTRGFIDGLTGAQHLPKLYFVDFSDSLAPLQELDESGDPEWESTPFESYEALFRAPIMDQMDAFRIRNARMNEAQFLALQAMRPELQFSVALDAPHVYVSHWNGSRFPHKHLLPFGG